MIASDDSQPGLAPSQPAAERLRQQLAFVREVDRLKGVLRRTALGDRSRRENSAEHSWHLAVMALALAEHAPPGTDVGHAVELLVVHDLVEIDAGDTFAFDVAGYADKEAREQAAASRIFGLLPPDVAARFRAWWDEFEAGATPEARFANALDRFQALVQNDAAGDGGTWREHGISREAVLRRMAPIRDGAPGLWPVVMDAVDRATASGHVIAEAPVK
ncbi:MAG TPA: HD domain-containing protein [Gemmatimonadaceae bacterium]